MGVMIVNNTVYYTAGNFKIIMQIKAAELSIPNQCLVANVNQFDGAFSKLKFRHSDSYNFAFVKK